MVLSFLSLPTFSTCGKKVFKPDELHITRYHKRSVLILMTSGVLRFREDGRDVALSRGEYYIQRPELLQEGIVLGEMPEYFYLEFYNGTYTESEENGLPLRGHFSISALTNTINRLDEAYHTHHANPFLLNSYMNRLLSVLVEMAPKQDAQTHLAELLQSELEARFSEPLSLAMLSHRFGYDKDHVIRIYRRRYGTTPHQALTALRMEHAVWLLENTTLSAKEISEAVGYRDFPTFYRAFRKAYEIAPGEYRKKQP